MLLRSIRQPNNAAPAQLSSCSAVFSKAQRSSAQAGGRHCNESRQQRAEVKPRPGARTGRHLHDVDVELICIWRFRRTSECVSASQLITFSLNGMTMRKSEPRHRFIDTENSEFGPVAVSGIPPVALEGADKTRG